MGFELVAEEKIREAIENGAFANLGTAGKPLRKTNDDYAGDDWLSLHVLESNGFLPEWLELRKQVYLERETVVEAMREWEAAIATTRSAVHALPVRAGELYRQKARSINAKIDLHNIRCPSIDLELVRFREDWTPKASDARRD